jgi:hypothetical protein
VVGHGGERVSTRRCRALPLYQVQLDAQPAEPAPLQQAVEGRRPREVLEAEHVDEKRLGLPGGTAVGSVSAPAASAGLLAADRSRRVRTYLLDFLDGE